MKIISVGDTPDIGVSSRISKTEIEAAIAVFKQLDPRDLHLYIFTQYANLNEDLRDLEEMIPSDDVETRMANAQQRDRVLDRLRSVSRDLLSHDAAVKRGSAKPQEAMNSFIRRLQEMDGQFKDIPDGPNATYQRRALGVGAPPAEA